MAAISMVHPPTGCRASRQDHILSNTSTPLPLGGTMHTGALDGGFCRLYRDLAFSRPFAAIAGGALMLTLTRAATGRADTWF